MTYGQLTRSHLDECEAISELLSAALDGEVSPREREIVEEHLQTCVACRNTQSAALALRDSLAGAAWPLPTDAARDDEVIARLRLGSVSGSPRVVRLGIAEGVSPPTWLPAGGPAPPALWERARTVYALIIPLLRAQFRRLVETIRSALQPALVTMAISFGVTWGALRWAETDASRAAKPDAPRPATAARPVDPDAFERWLTAGSPAMTAPAPFGQPPAKTHRRPALPRRGSLPHGPLHTG
jgi:hypothetical protein